MLTFPSSPLNVAATAFCNVSEAMDAGVEEKLLAHGEESSAE
jgi:hypothetical protein